MYSNSSFFFFFFFFFFNDTATTEIYTRKDTLSLHDALPFFAQAAMMLKTGASWKASVPIAARRSEEHTSELQSPFLISYAVFCLKQQKSTRVHGARVRCPLRSANASTLRSS